MAVDNSKLIDSLQHFELRLLRCSISPAVGDRNRDSHPLPPLPCDSSPRLHAMIEGVLSSIELGHYIEALSSDAVRTVFKFDLSNEDRLCDTVDSANRFYSKLVVQCITSFIVGDGVVEEEDCEKHYRGFLVMAIAVAAFLCFTQCNVTGPMESFPSMPLMELMPTNDGHACDWATWDVWTRNELMLAGSDLIGKFTNLQYMVFAKTMLMSVKDTLLQGSHFFGNGNRSVSWWLARLLLLQQKLLEERSSSLYDLLQVFMGESLHQFGTLQNLTSYWGAKLDEAEALNIVSALHLEVGLMELAYGRVDSSRSHFEAAESASGLHLSKTGALGLRTVYQVEPRAQRRLLTGADAVNCSDSSPSISPNTASNVGNDSFLRRHRELSEASGVFLTPRFLDNDGSHETGAEGCQIGGAAILKPGQQAVILAQCALVERDSRQDEFHRWDMAPYIEAIDSQQSTCVIIQFFCDLMRIRWESDRTRTKERALLMLDKLVQLVNEPSPGVADRIYFCYAVNIPCIPSLRREFATLLVHCGMIGDAVKVFEDLELWDNVIDCYSLLGKKAAAVELIKELLAERPKDPMLWCSLGDLTENDTCYQKAMEVSNERSARAKRSLARCAFKKGDYEMSKILWESAMALNALYPDGWFALGFAALKAADFDKALYGFQRAVHVDPENGEALNNIAYIHLLKKKNREAFIAYKEALKYKWDSWQVWENYSHVALDIGNVGQAMEAIKRVLEITKNKRVDTEFLELIMLEIEQRALSSQILFAETADNCEGSVPLDVSSDVSSNGQSANSTAALPKQRETKYLVELLGKILQQIVRTGGDAETWGLYARWQKIKGNLTMSFEARLKQVRSYQGSDLWKDLDRFKKFALASLELCKVYMELASCTGNRKELLSAEMHLKNIIKQAWNFSETEEYMDLQACLGTVQAMLEASSTPVSNFS